MPSIAICPNADIPVDIVKNLKGFETPLEGAKFLIEMHLNAAKGRLEASRLLAEVDDMVRKAKSDCIDEHFGD
ncbi:hypothetical protein CNR34_00115 [Pseudomonas phage nickie]|uniref:Uncharacterized protein n=1 Tax=Pseudomonas phage nickie TaxID=2048977 RepID=A0A2H4P7A2_9CAUD|nr:hypothetical protein FDJ16_gp050 [Pseudomonas phage nickie]ATW58048.1 hypothetical protein CNR34_00115 [Pseudomonas phage nickie]